MRNQKETPAESQAVKDGSRFPWAGELPVTEVSNQGNAMIGILTTAPVNGYGGATFRSVTIQPDGTWTATGEEEPVIIPLLK